MIGISPKKITLGLGMVFLGFLGISFAANDYCNQGDLMQQAFCIANNHSTVLDLGNTKKAVGNEVLNKGTIKVNIGGGRVFTKEDSLLVKVTKTFLMLTIVLSVTMIILNGIAYISKTGNGEDPKKLIWNLLYIALGILVALFSVVIINLMRSVGESTLEKI
ncbi:MAG: hypothetical protein LBO09_03570 [Candidatus Peribacteria bacterium]|jgi:hypothetical protein|nr:hypothetical protein [Candidatus Peribacteria bacterium]